MARTQAFSIRLPEALYAATKRVAQREGVSLNRFILDAIARRLEESVQARLARAYEVLAGEPDDVESLLAVQAEALLDD